MYYTKFILDVLFPRNNSTKNYDTNVVSFSS